MTGARGRAYNQGDPKGKYRLEVFNMDELQILNLADAPEHTEQVSRWLWEEWARADGYTLEEIV